MPLERDEDGNIVDEPTREVREPGRRHRAQDGPVVPAARTEDINRPTRRQEGDPTGPGGRSPGVGRHGNVTVPQRSRSGEGDGRTRIYRPGAGGGRDAPEPGAGGPRPGDDPMADPPVGWLTIVEGPGRGRVATLGIGVNRIGRGEGERVSLAYGDQTISEKNHATIAYEPRTRKFYIAHGDGTNLTYVDGEPVLAQRELEASMHVQMGETVLRFVPLCGDGFSWEDEPGGE